MTLTLVVVALRFAAPAATETLQTMTAATRAAHALVPAVSTPPSLPCHRAPRSPSAEVALDLTYVWLSTHKSCHRLPIGDRKGRRQV